MPASNVHEHASMSGEPRIRVLVVEDDDAIRRFVRMALELDGYEVHEATGVARGLIEAGTRRPDLVVLDLGLPDGDGVDLVRDLRGWSAIPVIVLSARSGEADKVGALDAGADDYLVKPFGAAEMLARIRAQLRRRARDSAGTDPVVRFGRVSVDLVRRTVTQDEAAVHLTPIEYRLLTHLVAQPDRVLTHRQLLKSVWGPSHVDDTHYLRVHMANLRKKLEDDPALPRHLVTETGVGYRFVPTPDDAAGRGR
jgi:two-component system, OmpR family, KDP operon response regulator KdpE